MHQLQVTESDSTRAGGLASRMNAAPSVDTSGDHTEPSGEPKKRPPRETGVCMAGDGSSSGREYTQMDSKPSSAGKAKVHDDGSVVPCVVPHDAVELLSIWATLKQSARDALVGVARGLANR